MTYFRHTTWVRGLSRPLPSLETTQGARSCLPVAIALFLFAVCAVSPAQQPGWFRGGATAGDRIEAAPLLADLNGDGRSEVLSVSFDDYLYIFNHDGTTWTASGAFPKKLDFPGGTLASVAVGDVTGDGNPEIVVAGDDVLGENGKVKMYSTAGTLLATFAFEATASGKATPCLIDCYRYNDTTRHPGEEIVIRDGLGKVHILVWLSGSFTDKYSSAFLTTSAEPQHDRFGRQPITPSVSAVSEPGDVTYLVAASTDGQVYRWRVTSTSGTSNNWQVSSLASLATAGGSGVKFFSSPTLANLDTDAAYELVAAANTRNEVIVWDDDGTTLTGWPRTTTQGIISSPAVANLNGSGAPEIIIGSDDGNVYAWHVDGTPVAGWPAATQGDVVGSPVVGELDGSPGLEVVVTSLDGRLYAWSAAGVSLPGWPKRLNTPAFASPAVGDIHKRGRMAIVAAGYDGRIFVFDLARKSLDPTAGWLQFRGGPKRQGAR